MCCSGEKGRSFGGSTRAFTRDYLCFPPVGWRMDAPGRLTPSQCQVPCGSRVLVYFTIYVSYFKVLRLIKR